MSNSCHTDVLLASDRGLVEADAFILRTRFIFRESGAGLQEIAYMLAARERKAQWSRMDRYMQRARAACAILVERNVLVVSGNPECYCRRDRGEVVVEDYNSTGCDWLLFSCMRLLEQYKRVLERKRA